MRATVLIAPFIAALQLQVGSLPAPQVPPRDRAPRPDVTGTSVIRGRVAASDTGMAMRRAMVTLSLVPPPQAGTNAAPTPESIQFRPRQTMTDVQGAFEFKTLPAGTYRVSASPDQYGSQYLGVAYGARRPLMADAGRTITVASGEVFDKADILLPRGGVITGRITDEGGQPLPHVEVYGLWYSGGSSRGMRMGRGAFTDDLGEFRLFGLQAGNYVLVAEARNGTYLPPNIDRSGESAGLITTYFPGTPDQSAAQKIPVALNRETPGIELRMSEGRLYRISGTVMDSQGRPAARLNGNLHHRSSDGSISFGSGFSTDEQGRFQMQNIAPGNYRIFAQLENRPTPLQVAQAASDPPEMALVPLSVVDADVEGLVIVLSRGATVSGQVVFEQGPPAGMTTPLRVSAIPVEQDYRGMTPQPAVVQPNFKFTFKGLIGEVLLRMGVPNLTLKQVLAGAEDITDTPHEFKDKDHVTVVLTSRASLIEGMVTDSKGAPVTESSAVIVFPEDKARWRNSSIGVRRASVDDTGHFQVRGILAGRYYIVAAPRGRLFVPGPADPSFFEGLAKDATAIYVGEDEQRTVDLKLVPLADQ